MQETEIDIAIYFEKIDLGDDKYVFKPINIIRGYYDKEYDQFETDYGLVCESLNSCEENCTTFFGNPTTMKELREYYGDAPDETLLTQFFNQCSENWYISYYDFEKDNFNTILIPLSSIEKTTKQHISPNKKVGVEVSEENIDDDSEPSILIDIESLKLIKQSKTIEEMRECIDLLIDILKNNTKNQTPKEDNNIETKEENKKTKENSSPAIHTKEKQIMSLKELRNEVKKSIIGQNQAVDDVTRNIYINDTSKNPRNKSHILITGPTGTGKTEIVKTIANQLTLPFFEADATSYTKEGYVGKNVYSMLLGLIESANGDVKKAEKGILIIDEIDKKLSSREDDVGGVQVLYALLKLMERNKIELDRGQSGYRDTITFDTSNLTIILMGAFENLLEDKLRGKKNIGFTATNETIDKNKVILTKEDLIKGGMPSQFLGRIGDVTSTNFFTIEELSKILTESNISPLLIQKEYLKDEFNVDLEYTDEFIEAVAKKAQDRKTNARELKTLIKESTKYAFDDLLQKKDAKVLRLTKKTVEDNRIYDIV